MSASPSAEKAHQVLKLRRGKTLPPSDWSSPTAQIVQIGGKISRRRGHTRLEPVPVSVLTVERVPASAEFGARQQTPPVA